MIEPGAVDSGAVVDNSVQGTDIGADALTGSFISSGGNSIDESTVARVPEAQNLSDRPIDSYISSSFTQN